MNPCAENFVTAEARMMVPKHRRSGGRENNEEFFDISMPSVVEDFTRRVLNEVSDIVRSEGVRGDTTT